MYRIQKQNAMTEKEIYAMLRLHQCLDLLGKACIFSTPETNYGHCLIEIEDSEKDKDEKTF